MIAAERIELRASQRSAFGCGAHAAVNLNRIGVLTDRCGAGDVWRIPSVKVTAHRRVIVRVRKRGSRQRLDPRAVVLRLKNTWLRSHGIPRYRFARTEPRADL